MLLPSSVEEINRRYRDNYSIYHEGDRLGVGSETFETSVKFY